MKDLKVGLLNEIYGDFLTEKQRKIVSDYYNADLSLGEIAELNGISRQAVSDTLKKAEIELNNFESKLKVFEKSVVLKDIYVRLKAVDDAQISKLAEEIKKII